MGRPKGSKNKTAEDKPEKNIVAPKVPEKNIQDDTDDPLDDLYNLQLNSVKVPTVDDKLLIERLSAHQLTPDEICGVLDISRSTYDASLALQAAYQRGQKIGMASLRRMQWKTAPRSPVMQIWLGKQYLGQTDKLETTRDDGSKDEARQRFEDKLKSIIDVTPTGSSDGVPDPGRSGGGELLLETVGEREPTCPDKGTVVEPREYPDIS